MVQNKTDKHPKLIRLPEVKRRTGFGKTWIYTLIDWPPESPDNQYHLNK